MTAYGLHEHLGLSSSWWSYRLWLKKHYPDTSLSAGSYPVTEGTTVDDLFSKVFLYEPQAQDVEITILPGWHTQEIEDLLNSKFKIQNSKLALTTRDSELVSSLTSEYNFLQGAASLEGFLYPDTYRVYPDATLEDIVRIMLDRFEEKIYAPYARSIQSLSFYDTLILASILEEEEKNSANKPVVAGILKKRLDENWFLGVDAAVCYELRVAGDECQDFVNNYYSGSQAYRDQLSYRYDTRRNLGLPPTPISSVSADTFEAVVDSESSPYYYYLHDST